MRKAKFYFLVGALLCVHLNLAIGGGRPNTQQQNLGKRPSISQGTTDKPDQAWEGTTLRSGTSVDDEKENERKREFRQQLNMQFSSKRPYLAPDPE